MGKEREGIISETLQRMLGAGLLSSAVLAAILFLCAALSNVWDILILRREIFAKIGLGISSLLCGFLSAGNKKQNRFVYAIAGESVLAILIVLFGVILGFRGRWGSFLLDAGIMFFGAFAGALINRKQGNKRRGIR